MLLVEHEKLGFGAESVESLCFPFPCSCSLEITVSSPTTDTDRHLLEIQGKQVNKQSIT